ncbi:PLP-dependent aminotransferase family protein [Agarivorans sp.]|uniref:aminotransferase-like domain-containing protein n=1 Tax=Agarivorans sp. TaxID=1872412 RepID=UPI003D0489BE
MAKFRDLAEKVVNDIQTGKLTPGSTMLSLRQFALLHNISVSTAVNCYAELQSKGWLIARPQSGFVIADYPPACSSPTWGTFSSQVAIPQSQVEQVAIAKGPLGTSRLQLDKLSRQQLDRSMRRVMRRITDTLSDYPELQGEPLLRQALACHFSKHGFPINSDELVITHGCMDAVKTALLVCTKPGDTVAMSSPCYNGLLELLSELSLRLIEIPSTADGIDLERLEHHLKRGEIQAGLFCTTHMNPQGITLTAEQKIKLAGLAEQYQVPVIEDDVYYELPHHQQSSLPTAYYDTSGYVIWCGSISKTLAPSYRLGWCKPGLFLPSFIKRMLGVPMFIQHVVADFIDSGAYANHLRRARYQLSQNKLHYLNFLGQHLPEGSCITQPEGGLVLWLQIPGLDAPSLATAAQEAGLDIRIGPWFTASERYQDCLRLNIGFEPTEAIEHELLRVIKLIRLNCC